MGQTSETVDAFDAADVGMDNNNINAISWITGIGRRRDQRWLLGMSYEMLECIRWWKCRNGIIIRALINSSSLLCSMHLSLLWHSKGAAHLIYVHQHIVRAWNSCVIRLRSIAMPERNTFVFRKFCVSATAVQAIRWIFSYVDLSPSRCSVSTNRTTSSHLFREKKKRLVFRSASDAALGIGFQFGIFRLQLILIHSKLIFVLRRLWRRWSNDQMNKK